MGLWYVYLMWRRAASHDQGVNWGRFLLTFESRWVADEYYMTLCQLKTANGQPRFKTMARTSAQLWAFDSVEESGSGDNGWWWAPIFIWRESRYATNLGSFANRVMHTYLSDGNHSQRTDWPILNDLAEGSDWISGKTFFIRNKRQRTRYWYDPGNGFVQVSTSMHTKFRITRTSAALQLVAGDAQQILTRDDTVEVVPVGSRGSPRYIQAAASGMLTISTTRGSILFRNFLLGLATVWKQTNAGNMIPSVSWADVADEGDEWELC